MSEIVEKKVLALKYRPKRFEDLIGQSTISQTLSLALDSQRFSHAYLFSGLRGSGKTSTARIMAKALLCTQGPTSKPCDECDNCKSANENRHLDIIEMDAASNRGIDDIKGLIEHTKYKPSSARFKVFIIDEIHMLTTQAFNALLKTLEEPPSFVKFILATTDPLKLPATILSRTQHFRFKRISNKDVVHHLAHILHEENIEYESEALEILSRSGQGSLRDTLTLLDQAIIFSKGKITTSSVTDMLGMIDPEFMETIFDIVLQKGDFISIVEELEEYELSQVCDEMTIYLKQKMLQNDKKFDTILYDRFFRIIADAKHLLSLNSNSGFVLILMLSKMVEATSLKTIDDVISEIKEIKTTPQGENLISQNSVEQTIVKEIEKTEIVEEKIETPESVVPQIDDALVKYDELIKKICERSLELGECFEKNFKFTSYEKQNDILHITSYAIDEDRKLLYKHFALIKTFIADVYGNNTQLEFTKQEPIEEKKNEQIIVQEDDDLVSSMIEDVQFHENLADQNSSCVENLVEKKSSNELQVQELLDSKMVNKAKELFDVKKINVQTKI